MDDNSEKSNELGSEESKSDGYEQSEPEQLTVQHLKQIAYELGLITLCWPEIASVEFNNRNTFPESYLTNNNKERLALLYAENFRRQYSARYPNRRQIMLVADNECGLQKLVCTTIVPTALPYPELHTWKSCSEFVADHIEYELLEKPTLYPERLVSPGAVFYRQAGHCFEIATALCSLLIAAGCDAYVVAGYAVRDLALRIRCRTTCPLTPEGEEEKVEDEEVIEPRYKLRPVPDLRSKFLLFMEQREIDRVEAIKQAERERLYLEMLELEKPPPDDLEGWRVHAWVLVLPKRDITEPFFIEPSTADVHPLSSPNYYSIESLWNHENYWVNVQSMENGMEDLQVDLTDITCWEHLLCGEPIRLRNLVIEQDNDFDAEADASEEKHLDMPKSWCEPIEITNTLLKLRYPNGTRTTHYKRAILQQFGEYNQLDGLKYKKSYYEDLEYKNHLKIEEIYEHRKDNLYRISRDVKTELITEFFKKGRDDSCRTHQYYASEALIESRRVLEFYDVCRIDGLTRLEMNPLYLKQEFVNREDRLNFRHAKFAPRGSPPPGMIEGVRRIVISVEERYDRNEAVCAHDDIAIREFALVQNEIHIKYHYAEGKVTASTRDFVKPNVAEMGDDLTFNPNLTVGYQAEVGAKPPKQLQLFYLLAQQLKDEEVVLYRLREIEDEVALFLRTRTIEGMIMQMHVSLFNREQNDEFRQGMIDKEEQARVFKEREVNEDIDYLAPYLVQFDEHRRITKQMSLKIKNECLTEFKQMLVKRANLIQEVFEKQLQDLQNAENVLKVQRKSLAKEAEEAQFVKIQIHKYFLQLYKTQLARHKELSYSRYLSLVTYLEKDPRLKYG